MNLRLDILLCQSISPHILFNDIVITIGKGNGSFLILLDLSAAFDTIDHDNLFMILESFFRYQWH